MLRSNTASLIAASAVLLASGGCITDHVDMAAVADTPLGQELHRMFQEEKRGAAWTELPAQF